VGPEARLDVKGGGADILNLRNSSGTKKVTVLENGNVGIGTTAPSSKLFVATGEIMLDYATGGSTNGAAWRLFSNANLAYLGSNQYYTTDTFRARAGGANLIRFDISTGATAGDISFMTAPTGAADAAIVSTERMRIQQNGNVGIGTTAPTNKLHILNGTTKLEGTAGSAQLYIAHQSTGNQYSSIIFGYDQGVEGVSAPSAIRGYSVDAGTHHQSELRFATTLSGTGTEAGIIDRMTITNTGNVGIGTASPTNLLSLGGNAARIFWMERHTTANTAGNTLTITAGGATAAATDKAGGNLILQGGLSTGSAESGVTIKGCVAGASGTGDRTQTTGIQVLGNKIGFYNVTPIDRAVLATGVGATVDNVITALQNLGLVSQS